MAEDISRPNPDELLARVKAEEKQASRGKLKVFLGYAPGVGKTFTMLEAAHLLARDTDVVVAYVDAHGRADTEALLQGLEIVPRREVEYRGVKLTEMDVDAVLARRPRLAIVDELAHENAPGSRHLKRYQDVEDLLDAGIDVYTTLNIQHIESGRDIVAQVTGVWIRETVPDSFVDSANEIELVDLPPDELLKRLREGKVYVPEQIAAATEKFFRKGNLTALRELTLRAGARHVDEETLAYMRAHAIRGPWPSGERLLVVVSPDSLGARLVRSARRLASELGAEWSALYVETPGHTRLSSQQQDQLNETLHLAQRLGAKTVTIQGDSAVRTSLQYAVTNNITKIVVARPQKGYHLWPFTRSLADQLMHQAASFDVHVVSRGETMHRRTPPSAAVLGTWRGHVLALALTGAATALGKLVPNFFDPTNMIMVYLLCVVASAFLWGYGPSVVVAIVSAIVYDFLFIPPALSFSVTDTRYLFTLFVLLAVGLAISFLMRRIRDQAEAATRRERQTSALFALGRDLAASSSLQTYVIAIVSRLKETLERDAIILLPDATNRGTLRPYPDRPETKLSDNDMAAAVWCYQHQRAVGHGTDTLPNAGGRFLPLVTARGTVGVLGLLVSQSARELTVEQERLLGAYADLAAVAIEGVQRGEEAHDAQVLSQVLKDGEKLQTALLNSISRDLRSPVDSIVGTLGSLQREGPPIDETARRSMVQAALNEAERLDRLIGNLLDITRLETGAMRITRQSADVRDLIKAATDQLGDRATTHPVSVNVEQGVRPVLVDSGLVVRTLVNILDNALKYSPPASPIEITVRPADGEVSIAVADRGSGIPAPDLAHVFDKFYRLQRPDKSTGTGLGLAICKGIVEAHGGHISAENRTGGGTIIKVFLPPAAPHP